VTDLFWPGDHLAGELMSDNAFLAAMVTVEQAWLDVIIDTGVAPVNARATLADALSEGDVEAIARGANVDGTPVSGLVTLLRQRTAEPTARWLHRGLTSQDVLDSALILCVRDVLHRIDDELAAQVQTMATLAETHRRTMTLARTLTQPALPSTIGVKVSRWLCGVLDAAEPLTDLRASLPVQMGGAAGTLAATTELAGSAQGAIALSDAFAAALGLAPSPPWHTTRSPVTRAGDALVTCCDAWGHIAADVATGSRAEIGELGEGRGGGSSTMPHKNNPVRTVLIRRTALAAGPLAATLHCASATNVDERPDGAWHAEWATLRTLARRTVAAAAHTTELLAELHVDPARCAANLASAGEILAEQRTMAELTGRSALPGYLGAADQLIDAALERAGKYLKGTP
jgi:3-carboxy-cis,cis-muconate cycloisomerase